MDRENVQKAKITNGTIFELDERFSHFNRGDFAKAKIHNRIKSTI